MSRYLGPRLRVTRRLGELPGFTSKNTKRMSPPGQHGPSKLNKKSSPSPYVTRLEEKQKLRFNYGVSEKQLYSYVKEAKRLKGATGLTLLKFLEMRLDNIIYRLGIALTIPSARQFITHGHALVNDKTINIPSFQCSVNDIISIKNKQKSIKLAKKNCHTPDLLGNYLDFDNKNLMGKVKTLAMREDNRLNINELSIVEFYSRK
jgi:small subunit ribosomal protein S4